MSTIWEMAAIIRAEEAGAATPARSGPAPAERVSIEAPGTVAYWCKVFGTTPLNLCCAIERVGHEPTALRRFLASRPRRRR